MKLTHAYRICSVSLLLIIFATPSWAITKAWLIGNEKAVRFNVETNTIEKEISLSINLNNAFLDALKGDLFILNSTRRYVTEIDVFDIKTMLRKGKLNISVSSETADDVQFLFPPSGNLFYLRWIKEEGSDPELRVYDTATFKLVNRYTTKPLTTAKLMLSETGNVLYSLVDDENSLKVDLFDPSNFAFKSSLDLKKFFGSNITGFAIHDYKDQKILISETSSTGSYKYVYDISTATISKKIIIKGEGYLLPKTNRIINLERQYIGKFKSMSLSTDYLFAGTIYIFDATAGQKISIAKIQVGQKTIGDIIGVSPLEDKLYVRTYNATGVESPKLHVIDLKTYMVIKEMPLPETQMKMIFYEA